MFKPIDKYYGIYSVEAYTR